MPIEFRCTNCQKLLRVPDETAGKQAKCPSCNMVLTIPSAEAAAVGPPPPPPAAINPYQAPTQSTVGPPEFTGSPGGFGPTRIDAMEVLRNGWQIFQARMGNVILVVGVALLIQFGFQFGSNFLTGALQAITSDPIVLGLASLFVSIGLNVFFLWLNIGQIIVLLKIARGGEATVGELFTGGAYLVRAIVVVICVLAFVVASMLPFVIPGIVAMIVAGSNSTVAVVLLLAGVGLAFIPYFYILLAFSPSLYLIVDRNAGALESLQLSREVTAGNKLQLLLVWIVGGFVYLLGFLACCVGVFFTGPLFGMIITVAYLSMTGQPTFANFARDAGPPVA